MAEIVAIREPSGWQESDLAEVCQRYPDAGAKPGALTVLRRLLDLEERQPAGEDWLGAEWRDLGTTPQRLMALEVAGLIQVEYRSNRHTGYRVVDPPRMRAAIEVIEEDGRAEPEPEFPADLFEVIESYDLVKDVLRRAIEAEDPVHVLLLGPPATAKSMFLSELGRLPGARIAIGGSTSRAGVIEFLINNPACRYLILDELDKADGRDTSALLSVMEQGRVSRLIHGRHEFVERKIWVFAGANSITKTPRELLSRFLTVDCPAYTSEQYERVAASILIRREGIPPSVAIEIAQLLSGRSQDIRDAVRLARLSKGRIEVVRDLLPVVLKGA